MKRVMVMGCAGAGKSTFARRLGALSGAPVIHLDTLFWEPGWVECQPEEFRRRVNAAHAGEAWVSDGNYTSRTFDIRVPRAEAIIWLDQPRWLCTWRVLARYLTNLGAKRGDLGVTEKLDWDFVVWVANYHKNVQPPQLAAIAALGASDRLITLRGDRAANDYLREIGAAQPSARAA